ncbi:MAG: ATP synthase F1 subunit gamma [Candidatus Riflebacteria bacterium]|nr:ATP synthase F1 subunit gamma [Candidatus Riflebacteria bacterium]
MAVLSLRAVRRKIRTVKNIQKITAAMKMVAAARLRRVQERVTSGKPYALKMHELVESISPYAAGLQHPLLEVREAAHAAVVVISGDKGLCGSFNNNILRLAQAFIDAHGGPRVQVLTIGRKATLYFTKRGYRVVKSFPQIGVNAPLSEVQVIARAMTEVFTEKRADQVHVAYTEFLSAMRQKPQIVEFLPIRPNEGARCAAGTQDCIFEPDAARLLETLLPRFVENQVYKFLLESMASEQGARMTAMTNATDSAGDLLGDLTTTLNKARQWTITKELLEVVSGAEALKAAH